MANKSKQNSAKNNAQNTDSNKRRGDRPGDKKVHRAKSKAPVNRSESLFDGIRKDRQYEREQQKAQRAEAAARREAFAERQHQLALTSPFIVNDRISGGVDGYARELAVRLVNLWADTSKEAVEAAKLANPAKADKVTRMSLATRNLHAQLRAEYIAEAQKDESLSAEAVKAKVNERVSREYGLRLKAVSAARDAVNYGFNKAKQGQ